MTLKESIDLFKQLKIDDPDNAEDIQEIIDELELELNNLPQ